MLEPLPEATGQRQEHTHPGEVTRADTTETRISSVLLIKLDKCLCSARAQLFTLCAVFTCGLAINIFYKFSPHRDCVRDE